MLSFVFSNVTLQWIPNILRICKIPGFNLIPKTGFLIEICLDFSQSLQAITGIALEAKTVSFNTDSNPCSEDC
jgi:hypothetical protein